MAATDQKNGPDPLTHRSVTVTDDPPRSRAERQTDPPTRRPLLRLSCVSASPPPVSESENRCDDDRNNIIEQQGPQATVPRKKPSIKRQREHKEKTEPKVGERTLSSMLSKGGAGP